MLGKFLGPKYEDVIKCTVTVNPKVDSFRDRGRQSNEFFLTFFKNLCIIAVFA